MTREEILLKADAADAAFNRHDATALAALYSRDARLLDQAAPGPIEGRVGVQQYMAGYFAAFPDLRWERIGIEVDGNTLVEEWRATGTHDGDLPGLPATHRHVSVDGCSVMHFDGDGLVFEEHNYWDEAAMLRQLGAMPAQAPA